MLESLRVSKLAQINASESFAKDRIGAELEYEEAKVIATQAQHNVIGGVAMHASYGGFAAAVQRKGRGEANKTRDTT